MRIVIDNDYALIWSLSMKWMTFILGCATALTACTVPVIQPVVQEVAYPVPVLVDVSKKNNAPVYVCSIKPFTQTYRSEHASRGQAKLDAQKQCLAQHSAMFCEEKDIVCQMYD